MKDSGIEWIGEIPEDVEVVNNKYLLEFIKGKNPNEINIDKIGFPYIGASDLDMDGDIHEYSNYCNEDLPLASKDDTLILWDGARAGLIGIGHEGYISSTIIKVIPRVDYINKEFWYWYLKGFQPLMNDWVGGTTIPHMNRKFINEICLLKFPLIQQQAIANFLDQKVSEIDHILKKTRESIEEYKKYKQSLITEAVTKGLNPDVEMKDSGIEWIGEIPKHWEVAQLKRFSYICNGKEVEVEIDKNSKESDNIIGVYGSGGIFKYTNIFLYNGESVLFGRKGTIGKPIYVNEKFWTVDTMYFMKFKTKLEPKYCYYHLTFYPWDKIMTKTALPSVVGTDVGNTHFTIPKKEEQKQIVDFLDNKCTEIDSLISQKEALISDLEIYKKSLIYECVTGKRKVD